MVKSLGDNRHDGARRGLVVIPARGGSKGLPRKNLAALCGRPLIVWAIEASRRAHRVSRIIVSTEDAEISQVARGFGAEVIDRPGSLGRDDSSSEDVLLHVLEELARRGDDVPEVLVLVQCTSPLVDADDIDGVIGVLDGTTFDCALAVSAFHHFLWHDTASGLHGVNHDASQRLPRQQLPLQYLETGAVYAMRTAGFLRARHRFFGKIGHHVVPASRTLEVDTSEDLHLAELRLADLLKSRPSARLPADPGGLVFDFDGVFTDNLVRLSPTGRESVVCSRADGLGIARVRARSLPMVVLSSETNEVVSRRCRKLGIPCVQDLSDKVSALRAWAGEQGIRLDDVIYVGNDVNDLDCLNASGCGVVVADAHPEAKAAADLVLSRPGGRGAVREICDMVLMTLDARS